MSKTKILAIFSAFAVGFLLTVLAAPEASAVKCYCTLNTYQTSTQSGYGYSCSQATADLESTLAPEADCPLLGFGTCNENLVITEECHAYSENEVEVVGYISYKCRWCGSIFP